MNTQTITPSALHKGQRVQLENGWFATLVGTPGTKTTVLARVEGIYTETGSVYVHDILAAELEDGTWAEIAHTRTQLRLRQQVQALGF